MLKWRFVAALLFLALTLTSARPSDNPYQVELPVYKEQPEFDALVPESAPQPQEKSDSPVITNGLVSRLLSPDRQFSGFSLPLQGGLFSNPPRKTENAIIESDTFGKKFTLRENIQQIVAGIVQPKPIVDGIQEFEKYGNTGQKYEGLGKAVVGGAGAVSNIVNSVLDVPRNAFKQITRTASEKLNNLGGRIIGL